MAPAAEILFQVMQNAMGGTAEPMMTPMKRYTQPRDRPIFLQGGQTEQAAVSTRQDRTGWGKRVVWLQGTHCSTMASRPDRMP
jgi:hypothetical protein